MSATMGMATSRNTLLEGSTVRNIYSGHSAFMGQIAVQMALAGFTGESDGVKSVYGSVLSDTYDSARVIDGLGTEWLMTQGYFKLHPTGRYVHTAIDALEDALAKVPGQRIDPADIRRVDVTAYKLAAMLDGKYITTSFGARFSIPFALATILYHGKSGLASFNDAAVANLGVQSLVQRMFVQEDPSYTAAYPGRQLCDVSIRLADGRTISGHCEMTKGESTRPHTRQELEAKFIALGNAVWGESVTRTLYDACMRLEEISDFREFSASLAL
jgi:2-methylcitrate dehydratase PrpD